MAQEIAVVNATLTATGSGTTDFTSTGFGTPTAAIVFVSNANTGSNPQAAAAVSVGFWDGTSQAAAAVSVSQATTMATYRVVRDDYIAVVPNIGAASTTWLAGYQASAITNGIRLTLAVDNTGGERYATVVLIKGVSAKLLAITPSASTNGTQESASLGFEPKAAIFACAGIVHNTPNSGSAQSAQAMLSFGAATEDGTQRMVGWSSEGAVADTDVTAKFSEDRVAGQIFNGAEDWTAEVTTWGADTITLTSRTAGAGGDTVFALILGGADVSAQVGTITTPTSNSTVDTATTGFDPDAVLLCMSNLANTTLATDATASGFAVGASDGTTHGGYANVDEDAAASGASSSLYSSTNAMLTRTSASGTASTLIAGAVSMGTEKFSINYTTVSGTARKGWYLAFGTPVGGSTPIGFDGTIATQEAQVGQSFSVDLSSYWSGTATPFAYNVQAGTLPAGLSLNASTCVISGTPTTAGAITGITLRGTDDDAATDDSNSFAFDVLPAALWAETEWLTNEAIAGTPRTAHYSGGGMFFGTVRQSDNAARVHRIRGTTLTTTSIATYGGTADFHNNPSVYVDASGYVYAAAAKHGATADILIRKSTAPYGMTFSSLTSAPAGSQAIFYPQLFKFGGDLYLFCNRGTDRDVVFCKSTDDGSTWSGWTVVFESQGGGVRPYFAVHEVDGELLMLVTRGHPTDETIGTNDAYFLRFDGTDWKEADGTNYTLPVTYTTGEVCFDASVASSNFSYFIFCQKDSTGRYVAIVEEYTSSTDRRVSMIRYASGSWSRALITHPIAGALNSPSQDRSDPYRFLASAVFDSVQQACLVTSADDGATWSFVRQTDGALTRTRGGRRTIFGTPPADKQWLYVDTTSSSTTSWTTDVYTPFASVGTGFPDLSDLQAVSITATTVQGTYDYAF